MISYVTGCSSTITTRPSHNSSSSTAAPTPGTAAAPADFSGPVVARCNLSGQGASTVSKLNIDTGELFDIAHFPGSCPEDLGPGVAHGDGGFTGQDSRLAFNRDFTKGVVQITTAPLGVGHVGYYDAKKGTTVDVSQLLTPTQPSGDFGQPTLRNDSDASFDENGLFTFFDYAAGVFDFVDTDSMKIVKTSTQPFVPHYVLATQQDGGPSIRVNRDGSYGYTFRTCNGMWLVNDNKYLKQILGSHNNGHDLYVGLEDVPPPQKGTGDNLCGDDAEGHRITPSMDDLMGAATDATGSTVLFWLPSRTTGRTTLYRANSTDPQHPIEVAVPGDALGTMETTKVSIIDWQ